MAILSIQSHVAYGYVGNRAATFPLQRLKHDVWAINTVQFSNHTGYGTWQGQVFDASHIYSLLEGLEEREILSHCDAVLSGYIGDYLLGDCILEALKIVRKKNQEVIYCCDPVMGDVGRGFFVRPGIPEFMRHKAVPAADIITPNQFEAEALIGQKIVTMTDAVRATQKLHEMGPKIIIITSLRHSQTAANRIEMLLSTQEGRWRVSTPHLPIHPAPNGAGDAVAALFLAHWVGNRDTVEAFGKMTASIFAIIEETFKRKSRELALVASQEEFVNPSTVFPPIKVA